VPGGGGCFVSVRFVVASGHGLSVGFRRQQQRLWTETPWFGHGQESDLGGEFQPLRFTKIGEISMKPRGRTGLCAESGHRPFAGNTSPLCNYSTAEAGEAVMFRLAARRPKTAATQGRNSCDLYLHPIKKLCSSPCAKTYSASSILLCIHYILYAVAGDPERLPACCACMKSSRTFR
jgi:hypothetical protein